MTNSVTSYNNNFSGQNITGSSPIFNSFETFIPQKAEAPKKDSFETSKKKLQSAKNQNGLIEKTADYIKSKTGFAASVKSIQKEIDEGKKSEEEINKDIKNYRRSQENIAHAVSDTASAAASIYTFFKVKNFTELWGTKLYTQNKENINSIMDDTAKKSRFGRLLPYLEKKPVFIAAGAIASTLAGSQVKPLIMTLNRIGTKQYDAEINDGMESYEIKQAKKDARSAKWGANFRNLGSGAINGITAPILALGPVGAPIYAMVNSLSRYFIAEKEDKGEKSLDSFTENISNSKLTNAVAAAAILTAGIKKAKYNKVFEENLAKAMQNIEAAAKRGELKPVDAEMSSYEKLEEILFAQPRINEIVNNYSDDVASIIEQLSKENIFALKFKQIKPNFGDPISLALKENCPPTRDLYKAQEYVNTKLGENEYTLTQLVGVGTIAETYLAKDKTGKEVCIKMLKDGISKEKIIKDRDAFIQMIKDVPPEQITADEREFLISNVKNIADGVIKEVDFTYEMNAANELAKVTKQSKVVKPIEVKNNVYIMEKADGISLQNLLKEIKNPNSQIKLSTDEAKDLLGLYQNVLIEQFSKVNAEGKIIHGDIHPGNIFIDLEALRAGRKDSLTLIDTGNTINQDTKNAIRFMRLSKYINDADVENIAKFVLEGAKLPENMTQEQAYKIISEQLSELFFSTKNTLPPVNNDNILKITESIMQKAGMIPADTQGNLMKAKTSASTSLMDFYEALARALEEQKTNRTAIDDVKMFLDIMLQQKKYGLKKSAQEEANFTFLNPLEKRNMRKSESTPEKNSLEYLTYALKQYKTDKIDSETIENNLERIMKNMFSV